MEAHIRDTQTNIGYGIDRLTIITLPLDSMQLVHDAFLIGEIIFNLCACILPNLGRANSSDQAHIACTKNRISIIERFKLCSSRDTSLQIEPRLVAQLWWT